MRWVLVVAFVGASVAASLAEREPAPLSVRLGPARILPATRDDPRVRSYVVRAEVRVRPVCLSLTTEPRERVSVGRRFVPGERYVDELAELSLQPTEPRVLRFPIHGFALAHETVHLRLEVRCDDGYGTVRRAQGTALVTLPGPRPRALRPLVATAGKRPPRALLGPFWSSVHLRRWGRGRLVALWRRSVRDERGSIETEQGAIVWQRRPERGRTAWRQVYRVRAPEYAYMDARAGDVTGDGDPELLLEFGEGSGNCGTRRLLHREGPAVAVIFRRWSCDTSYLLRSDGLVVDAGVYVDDDSHCCPSFTRRTTFRWNGRRFVAPAPSLFLNCVAQRCLHWRRVIVDAAPVVLGRPGVHRRRVATIRFRGCLGGCYRVARTTDGGATWTARP